MNSVIVVDDHKSLRESFALAVAKEAPFSFIGLAGSAREAYELIEKTKPDLLVLDVSLEDSDGVAVAWELKRRKVVLPILMLTMHTNGLLVREALDAGVRGYATKNQPLSEIIQAMHACIAGERYLSPSIGVVPERSSGRSEEDPSLTGRLSRREREIFSHVIRGQSSEHIARSLSISLKTVETHRAHINRKLGVHSPAELVRLAALKGLLPEGPWASRDGANGSNGSGTAHVLVP
jgi:DNA-binding NarL/FixJ family response regulator